MNGERRVVKYRILSVCDYPLALCVVWLGGLLWSGAVLAQMEAEAVDKAAARTLAVEGMELAHNGRCAEAIDRLERAEALHHSPIVRTQLGECYIAAGRLIEGTELLREVLRERLSPEAATEFAETLARARSVVDSTTPQIGTLHLNVEQPENAAEVTVLVDGHAVRSALLGADRPTDPGEHTVEAQGAGLAPYRQQVTLAPGERLKLAIRLEPSPDESDKASDHLEGVAIANASASAGSGAQPAGVWHQSSARADSGPIWLAYVAWGIAGTSLLAGVGAAIWVTAEKSELSDRCDGSLCPASAADDIAAAEGAATLSAISLGVSALTATAGVVLWLLLEGDTEEQRSEQRSAGVITAMARAHSSPMLTLEF